MMYVAASLRLLNAITSSYPSPVISPADHSVFFETKLGTPTSCGLENELPVERCHQIFGFTPFASVVIVIRSSLWSPSISAGMLIASLYLIWLCGGAPQNSAPPSQLPPLKTCSFWAGSPRILVANRS